jgi:predicted Zn-dependent peptidase
VRKASILVVFLAACSGGGLPRHPDELRYRELRFDVPDAAAMRVEIPGGAVGYLVEDAALPLVDLQILARRTAEEPAGKEGLAGFTASLMRTGGTASRTPEALDEELEFLAAEVGVGIGETHATASLSVLAKDLDKGLEILGDILRNPAFRQEKLDVLKAQALEGMRARNDSTASIEAREANLVFFGAGFPTNRHSTKASMESIAREDLVGFHARSFHPSAFVVAASGAFKRDELVRKLGAMFKDWPHPGGKPLEAPKPGPEAKPGVYCFHKEGKNVNQGRVTAGHMGIDVRHPDLHAIRLANYVLGGGGFSSRLVHRVRAEEGLAYDVHSDYRPGLLWPLPFRIQFQSKSEACAYAARLCLEEIGRLQREGVTPKELGDAQRFYLDGFPGLFFSTKSQTVATYAQAELLGIPKDYYATYREKIARLTPADVQRAAREHFKPGKLAWIVVGDVPAIKKGDAARPGSLGDLGPVVDVPLPDPLTLERPK